MIVLIAAGTSTRKGTKRENARDAFPRAGPTDLTKPVLFLAMSDSKTAHLHDYIAWNLPISKSVSFTLKRWPTKVKAGIGASNPNPRARPGRI